MSRTSLALALDNLALEHIRRMYWEQHEAVFLEHALPPAVIEPCIQEVEAVRDQVHRSFLPGHKQGGAVSYHALLQKAPSIVALYQSPLLLDFLSQLVGARLMRCPDEDLHACALYVYTEPGDHIGWHYDTSYYQGARYTVLVGLIERSTQCRLVAQLYKDDPHRDTQEVRLPMDPGSMVIFNGDKLWHAVTPLEAGAERILLTLQYVTTQRMRTLQRIRSNLKDTFAYFGSAALVRRKPS